MGENFPDLILKREKKEKEKKGKTIYALKNLNHPQINSKRSQVRHTLSRLLKTREVTHKVQRILTR